MSSDTEPDPVVQWVRRQYEAMDVSIDYVNLALYANFIFVGIALGAIFTIVVLTNQLGPENVRGGQVVEQVTLEMEPGVIYSARNRVLLAAVVGFLVTNAVVLYDAFRGEA